MRLDDDAAEVERLREGLRNMKQAAFELVRDDPAVPLVVLHIVGARVDELLGEDD